MIGSLASRQCDKWMSTKYDGNFLVGFDKRVRHIFLWKDDDGSIDSGS